MKSLYVTDIRNNNNQEMKMGDNTKIALNRDPGCKRKEENQDHHGEGLLQLTRTNCDGDIGGWQKA